MCSRKYFSVLKLGSAVVKLKNLPGSINRCDQYNVAVYCMKTKKNTVVEDDRQKRIQYSEQEKKTLTTKNWDIDV